MSGVQLDPDRAQQVVEARLGRQPQDMLEAAVVLEAWAGVPAKRALDSGRALMHASEPQSEPSRGSVPKVDVQEGYLFEAISFVAAVIAIACWASPLASALGASVVERGLFVALPLTLALQWGLRSRYLGRPEGLAQLGRHPRLLVLGAYALVGIPSALLGLSGTVAGLLTLTWCGGTIMIRRRWSAFYAVTVGVGTVAMLAGLPALSVLAGIGSVTTFATALAVRSRTALPGHPPGRWGRALTAGVIGAGLGVMLVADGTVNWSVGAVPALALLPSTVASFWGGYHLWQFQQVIPRALSGVAVSDSHKRGLAWPALKVLLGAVGRLLALTALLSVALVAGAELVGSATSGITVLVGFGLVGLATLLVSLLESVGRSRWALMAVICAIAAEQAVRLAGPSPFPAAALIAGASLAVLVALPAAIALLSRPASTLATSLWIR
jgi:hypothetical protein